MMQPGKPCTVVMLLLATFMFAQVTRAEIYKWVDSDGNVHFGDKPHDAAQAAGAEPVELRESYKPAVRTTDDQAAHELQQREARRVADARRREREDSQAQEQAKHHQTKTDLCARYDKEIRALSTMDVADGGRTYYYLTGEDGKSISSARQREIVEELKIAQAEAGCP